MDSNIILYVKRGCPWCSEATAWLDQHGFEYEEVDVSGDPAAFAEMRKLSGQSCAPTMTIGDLMLADFGAEELEDFMREHDFL
jgi:glutaredoxin 3